MASATSAQAQFPTTGGGTTGGLTGGTNGVAAGGLGAAANANSLSNAIGTGTFSGFTQNFGSGNAPFATGNLNLTGNANNGIGTLAGTSTAGRTGATGGIGGTTGAAGFGATTGGFGGLGGGGLGGLGGGGLGGGFGGLNSGFGGGGLVAAVDWEEVASAVLAVVVSGAIPSEEASAEEVRCNRSRPFEPRSSRSSRLPTLLLPSKERRRFNRE